MKQAFQFAGLHLIASANGRCNCIDFRYPGDDDAGMPAKPILVALAVLTLLTVTFWSSFRKHYRNYRHGRASMLAVGLCVVVYFAFVSNMVHLTLIKLNVLSMANERMRLFCHFVMGFLLAIVWGCVLLVEERRNRHLPPD